MPGSQQRDDVSPPPASSATASAADASVAAARAAPPPPPPGVALAAAPVPYAPPSRAFDPGAPFPAAASVFPFLPAWAAEHAAALAAEAAALPGTAWSPWPETALYDAAGGARWTVLPIFHTLPASDAAAGAWVPAAAAAAPATAAALARLPGLRTALLSRMGPRTTLAPHSGWAPLANHVLRVHLPLAVPAGDGADGAPCCGVVVGDAVAHHARGELLVFDDSKEHSAFNAHATADRVVLIVDLARPAEAAPGAAEGGTTAELLAFRDAFMR